MHPKQATLKMSIATWFISDILALMFGMAGFKKSTLSIEVLVKTGITWADRFSISTIRLIGISELLGAVGLILPWLLNIMPILTPIAASGLSFIMLLVIFHHVKHKENKAIALNVILMLLSGFVSYSRYINL